MPKSRSRRRQIPWRAVFFFGLVLNLVVGFLYSPLTRINKVRVVGAWDSDKPRIQRRLEALGSTPYFQINRQKVESDLQTLPGLRTAEFNGNPFGKGVLKLVYRAPVAKLVGAENTYVDREGVMFRMEDGPENLYRIQFAPGMISPGATLASPVVTGHIAELCGSLRMLPAFDGALITYDSRQGICLNKDSRRIVLGPPDGMEEKLATLEKATLDPRWSSVAEVNLMAPKQPSYRPRSGAEGTGF